MRSHTLSALLAGALLASPAAAQVHIRMADGTVTVSARDATVREILSEWARVGQTRIVNVDRVIDVPMSLELVDVPEAEALDTILRSVSGYLAAPRTTPVPDASLYDRIFLLASSGAAAPPTTASAASPAPDAPPSIQPDEDQDRDVDIRKPGTRVVATAQVFPPFPERSESMTDPVEPPGPGQAVGVRVQGPTVRVQTASAPTPVGVPTPGMIVPSPEPHPGQPGFRR